MGKGSLNVGLKIVCTEAERAAITLSHHPHALPHLVELGYAADGVARLNAVAEEGRKAYTASGRAGTHLKILQAEGRDLAKELYALHRRARMTMQVIEHHDDADVATEARAIRMGLTLQSPRLASGLEGARFLRDALSREDTPLTVVSGAATLRELAVDLVDRAQANTSATQRAKAVRRRASREATAARDALIRELRCLRIAWKAAQVMGVPLPNLVYELVRAATTKREVA